MSATQGQRLAVWLMRAPAEAVRLELRYENLSGQQTIAAWQRPELDNRDAVEQIVESAQDHAENVRARCRFEIVWLDENSRVLRTKGLFCEPEEYQPGPAMVGAGDPPREDGTAAGLVSQLMRHVENRERLLNIALSTNLRMMVDQVKDARTESQQLRDENRQLRQRIKEQETADPDDNGEGLVEAEARAAAIEKLTNAVCDHVLPIMAARMREGMQ